MAIPTLAAGQRPAAQDGCCGGTTTQSDCLSELPRAAIVVNHPGDHSAFGTLAEIVGDLFSGGQAIMLVTRPN